MALPFLKDKGLSGRYGALFRTKGVPLLIVIMTVARMPTGCITILLVLFVSETYGTAVGGMATAAWTIGTAVFAPMLGRLVDQGKGPATLRISAALELMAVTALIGVVLNGHPDTWLLAIVSSFVAGALMPPVSGTTRSLWQMLVGKDLLPVAYSFEILLIDVLFVSGPLLASAFIMLGVPVVGMAFTMACLAVGSVALSFLEPVKAYARLGKARGTSGGKRSGLLLRLPQSNLLLIACLCILAFSGWLETLLPLYYNSQGNPMASGITIGIWSIGSIIGVLVFIRMQPDNSRMGLVRQLILGTVIYLVVTALFPLFSGNFWAMSAVLFAVGLTVSPITNLHYQLGGELAPDGQHAEMFSWLNTATSVGISIGAFLAGNSIELIGYSASFMVPVVFVVIALVLTGALAIVRRGEGSSELEP